MFLLMQSGNLRAAGVRHGTQPGIEQDAPPTEVPAGAGSGGWANEPVARSIRVTNPSGCIEEDTIEAGVAILIWEGDFDVCTPWLNFSTRRAE
jgi:hypothetical protein